MRASASIGTVSSASKTCAAARQELRELVAEELGQGRVVGTQRVAHPERVHPRVDLEPLRRVRRICSERPPCRIEATQLSRRLPVPAVQDEIGRLVETFNQMIARLESSFEAEGDPEVVVSGDERWLRQLVQNLVENAVRFSPVPTQEKPAPLVAIKVRSDGRDALLTVEDEGPGIPEEERKRIFERFYRVDASRHRNVATGAGLGLAICSWIVEAHRGRIEASERQGDGTVISVRFPES